MKSYKITIALCLFAFVLQAQDKAPTDIIKLSLNDLFFRSSAGITYERHIKDSQSLEVGLNIPLKERRGLEFINGFIFFAIEPTDVELKRTTFSVGYKFYAKMNKGDKESQKRFSGVFLKPEVHIGYQNKFKPLTRENCWLFGCSLVEEFKSENMIYGVMLRGGAQKRIKKDLTIEATFGLGYGIGHSTKTMFRTETESGALFDAGLSVGYSF